MADRNDARLAVEHPLKESLRTYMSRLGIFTLVIVLNFILLAFMLWSRFPLLTLLAAITLLGLLLCFRRVFKTRRVPAVQVHRKATQVHRKAAPTKTKADLVKHVAALTGYAERDTATVVDAFLNALCNALEENHRVEIRGLGVFKNKKRKSRVARSPKTGASVQVPSRLVPTFKPSERLIAKVK